MTVERIAPDRIRLSGSPSDQGRGDAEATPLPLYSSVPTPPRRPGRTVDTDVIRVRDGRATNAPDVVAAEEPLEIRIVCYGTELDDAISVSITMRTPGHDFELAVGFLRTEGIVRSSGDVARVDYCVTVPGEQMFNVVNVFLSRSAEFDLSRLGRNFYMTSSCGVCGKASLEALCVPGRARADVAAPRVLASTLLSLRDRMDAAQTVFQRTGGLHAAALFSPVGELRALREDVGRHNAVDKVLGSRWMQGHDDLRESVMLVSGRTSFEIMQKAVVAGVPFVAGVGAPSSLAVDTAREFGLTLVGFLGPDGFNVYAGAKRVELGA